MAKKENHSTFSTKGIILPSLGQIVDITSGNSKRFKRNFENCFSNLELQFYVLRRKEKETFLESYLGNPFKFTSIDPKEESSTLNFHSVFDPEKIHQHIILNYDEQPKYGLVYSSKDPFKEIGFYIACPSKTSKLFGRRIERVILYDMIEV